MAEIPGFVWIGVGGLIGAFSFFLGFLKPAQNNLFFRIMMFVGLGMMLYGFIKMRFMGKTKEQMIDDLKLKRRGESEVDIDIEDYRRNPQLRQQVLQRGGQQSNSANSYNGTPRNSSGQSGQYPSGQSPNLQQQPLQGSQQLSQSSQSMHNHHQSHSSQPHQVHPHNPNSRFCHQCGSPLLKEHKYCPVCGARV
jgi:hypothetical protein